VPRWHPGRVWFPSFARAARSPTCRLVRRGPLYAPPVLCDDEAQGALTQNPNGNATRFVNMDEVFPVDTVRPPGQPPDAARQPGSELERTARPSGTERGRTKQKGGARGRRVLLASPGSVLGAAMCRVAPELHRQPKTPHAPAADKDSERCIKRTNLNMDNLDGLITSGTAPLPRRHRHHRHQKQTAAEPS